MDTSSSLNETDKISLLQIDDHLVTLPVSQIIADWKQQNATDAVQKIARFAAMFGSVTHSHQPHVTWTHRIKAGDNKRHTRPQPRRFTEETSAVQPLDTESGMRRERETRESSTIHHPTSCQIFPILSDILDPFSSILHSGPRPRAHWYMCRS